MTSWLSLVDRTKFCSTKQQPTWKERIGELLFAAILGLVYIFTYITPSEGKTRVRYIIYYMICFAENLVAAVEWATKVDPSVYNTWYYLPLLVCSVLSFLLGIMFMLLYYLFFHPRVPSIKKTQVNSGSSLASAVNVAEQSD